MNEQKIKLTKLCFYLEKLDSYLLYYSLSDKIKMQSKHKI